MRRVVSLLAVHGLLAVLLTWPAAVDPVHRLPGSIRTDLWDSLWSFWFAARELGAGRIPISVDGLLNHPEGGTLWVADLVNALVMTPLLPLLGLPAAYTLLVIGHSIFSGISGNVLGRAVWGDDPRAGWFTGMAWQSAPILLAHVHNGASEAIGGGWLALAMLTTVRFGQTPNLRRGLALGGALAVTAWAHWYGGVCAFLFVALYAADRLIRGGQAGLGRGAARWVGAVGLGLILVLPAAYASRTASTAADNVVGIKTPRELSAVRRTIGAADPRTYVIPGEFYAPDFRAISPYNEQHRHCSYLGWVVLIGAGLSLRRGAQDVAERRWVWWGAAALGGVLALGPVLTLDGAPVILARKLAFPLPYLLVEPLPGFESLSLVWRLAALPALCLSVLAGGGWAKLGRGPWWLVAAGLCVAETRFVSPMAGGLATVDAEVPAPVVQIAGAPAGAVMNFPVAGGRPFLYEQTAHGQALAGTLNFPNNKASMAVWKLILDNSVSPGPEFPQMLAIEAEKYGVRYLVVHVDPWAPPDMHDVAVRALRDTLTPMAETAAVRVYRLY